MSPAEILSIILGSISVVLAIGINMYRNKKEKETKEENEQFFVEQIQNNLKKMSQYFLDVEDETKYKEEFEEDTQNMMNALNTFYLRHDQEMKDVLYQTKLYLPFWTGLSSTDKKTVNKILNVFSWLLYDYFPMSISEPMRKITVLNFRETFSNKKTWMMNTTSELLHKYPTSTN